jgi:hypothetical protein
MVCDLTLGLGKVAYDYLDRSSSKQKPARAAAGVA